MSKLVHCRVCNHKVSSTADFCPQCGEGAPGISNQELEERAREAKINMPGCSLSIFAFLAATLILGLIQLATGIELNGAVSLLVVVLLGSFIRILWGMYIKNKSQKLY